MLDLSKKNAYLKCYVKYKKTAHPQHRHHRARGPRQDHPGGRHAETKRQLSAKTRWSKNASWTPWTWSGSAASPSWPRTRPSGTRGVKINIVDTPGHADFGGEVERSLNMVDGALLLVDASEGPLPQTRFVVKKALAMHLPIILVINKIDRSDARIQEVVNEVYDLFIDLDAKDEHIEFPILYTNAKTGVAHAKPRGRSDDLRPLFETILNHIPGPAANDDATPQFLVTNLDYDSYVGQIAIGRLINGKLEMNKPYSLCGENRIVPNIQFVRPVRPSRNLSRIRRGQGGIGRHHRRGRASKTCSIGDTISSLENPVPLPRIHVDEPTVSMIFYVNNGPFAGKEGKYLTSRHLKSRLEMETLKNVAIQIKPLERKDAFEVCGRGELQMAILIETMRREGYEFMVSKPHVITKEENGVTVEPVEHLYLDMPEESVGIMTERLAVRKGRMTHLAEQRPRPRHDGISTFPPAG